MTTRASLKSSALLVLLWTCVTTLLAFPRLRSAEFGAQGDLPVHYHLLRAFWRCTQEGDWLPQWAGLLDGGRGDAIFTFYPPLAYWLGVLFLYVSGASLLSALKFLTVFSLWFAQFSAYLFARHFFSKRLSVLVSVAYVLLPTFGLLALHRAFLPNALALAEVPLVLLGAFQLLTSESRWQSYLLFTLSFAALMLTHVITTYLCGWLLLFLLFVHPSRQNIFHLGLACVLALALTAFFWLPQQLEMRWVQVGLQLTQQDFSQYLLFAPLTQDTPFRRAWHGLNELASWMTLLQTALSFAMAALLWRYRTGSVSDLRVGNGSNEENAKELIVKAQVAHAPRSVLQRWAIVTSALGLLISLPLPLWRIVPGLAYVQFPWRWQPFTALGAAILCALAFTHWRELSRLRRFLLAPIVALCSLCLLVLTAQIARAPQAELSTTDLTAQLNQTVFAPVSFESAREMPDELQPLRLALTANQVYFRPVTADQLLYPPTETYGGLTILRGRGNVSAQQINNQHRSFQINAIEPLQVKIETYAYPHWTARLDGQPLTLQTESDNGLMRCDIPAGTHTFTLEFAPQSFLYLAARWLSGGTWLLLFGWMMMRVARRQTL